MLEKFIDFLSGESEETADIEGNFLDHAVDGVEETVRDELDRCPEHDPLLLLAVEVLRASAPEGRWSDASLPCPVEDGQSPGRDVPPPPPGGDPPAAGAEETEPTDESPADDTSTGESEDDGDATDAPEDATVDADSPETDGASDDGSEETPGGADEVDERLEGTPEAAGYSIESTVELDSSHPETSVSSAGTPADVPDLGSDLVLQAARVFFGVLLENHRLPADLQMGGADIRNARELLLAYYLDTEDVQVRAREMLSAVEDKFNDGMFSQARILLKLFDADRETRVENDRNLFYEEMILRFGIKRRHPLAERTADSYSRQIGELDADLQDRTDDLFDWLSEEVFVSMNVLGRPVEKREKWREIAANSTREGAIEDFTETFPPRMWRRPEAFSKDLVDLVEEQLSERIVADYIIRHVKACFFILRAVGDTGLEAYLDVFFDWVERDFDVDGPAVLPELYHETTEGNRLIEDIFDDVFRRHFRESAIEYRENWDRDELETAVDGALEHLVDSDPEEIPPGHYDFGGFVLDELFELEYPSDEFRFKLHRLT